MAMMATITNPRSLRVTSDAANEFSLRHCSHILSLFSNTVTEKQCVCLSVSPTTL